MLDHLTTTLPSILREYHGKHNLTQVPVQVDHLLPMFEQRGFADRIILEAYDYPASNIAAQVSFYAAQHGVYAGSTDYARIQFSKHLNFCWQRFAICKEMYHCIIDGPTSNRTTSVADLMKLSELLVSGAGSMFQEFDPLYTEMLAEILALETLFPLELRNHHREAYSQGQITDYQLALRYRIPEEHARLAMYTNYIQSIEARRDDLIDIDA